MANQAGALEMNTPRQTERENALDDLVEAEKKSYGFLADSILEIKYFELTHNETIELEKKLPGRN